MPLGMEVNLGTEVNFGTGDVVLDVVSASPPRKGAQSPSFRPMLLWPRSPISATAELLLFNIYIDGLLTCLQSSDLGRHIN